jgi:alpha-L-fucosidase
MVGIKHAAFLFAATVSSCVCFSATFADRHGLFNRRLGMFVHWGIYSVGEWHEQEEMRRGVPRVEYEKYKDRFCAEKFSPDHFVDIAESAGAEYIVITTKHHDGFCMWDTKTTDFKVTNTPAGRDVIGELAAACKRRGMKLGFYYSNPDWHHPNAYNDKSTHQIPPQQGDAPDMEKYIDYVKAQVTELLTNYGEIVCFFWDIPTKIYRPEMDELVRRLQPGIMVNDRGWGNKATCDYSTPERDYEWDLANGRHIESCDSVGVQSWGYRADEDYHTHGYLTRNIDRYLSTGANFLLNVGPKADGTIPDEARAIMADVGKWYGKVRDSFRNVKTVSGLKFKIAPNAVVTRRDDTLFVHFPTGLDATGLDLRPLTVMPEKVTLLNTGKALNARVELMPRNVGDFSHETLHVWGIPADELANECIVLRLDFAPGALDAK